MGKFIFKNMFFKIEFFGLCLSVGMLLTDIAMDNLAIEKGEYLLTRKFYMKNDESIMLKVLLVCSIPSLCFGFIYRAWKLGNSLINIFSALLCLVGVGLFGIFVAPRQASLNDPNITNEQTIEVLRILHIAHITFLFLQCFLLMIHKFNPLFPRVVSRLNRITLITLIILLGHYSVFISIDFMYQFEESIDLQIKYYSVLFSYDTYVYIIGGIHFLFLISLLRDRNPLLILTHTISLIYFIYFVHPSIIEIQQNNNDIGKVGIFNITQLTTWNIIVFLECIIILSYGLFNMKLNKRKVG